jgi:hypothetical protein
MTLRTPPARPYAEPAGAVAVARSFAGMAPYVIQAVGCGERVRQARQSFVQQRVDLLRAERVTDRLYSGRSDPTAVRLALNGTLQQLCGGAGESGEGGEHHGPSHHHFYALRHHHGGRRE